MVWRKPAGRSVLRVYQYIKIYYVPSRGESAMLLRHPSQPSVASGFGVRFKTV